MLQQDSTASGGSLTIGGELYHGKEDYLRSIMRVYDRVNGLSFSNGKTQALLWDLKYCAQCLINSIVDGDDRDEFTIAFEKIRELEYRKRASNQKMYKTFTELKTSVKDSDAIDSEIDACMFIIGETRQYYDRYMGLEKKMSILLRTAESSVRGADNRDEYSEDLNDGE